MKIIGITGNIGVGKSYVANIIAIDYRVISLDDLGHDLIRKGMPAYDQILKIWPGVIQDDGEIDRKIFGNIIFSSPDFKKKLDDIMVPKIKEALNERIVELRRKDVIFVDGALIIEFGLTRILDDLIVVTCSPETQLKRIIKRDGISREEALERINSQLPQECKLGIATSVIWNEDYSSNLRVQIKNVLNGMIDG
jgi:dephospho-CoA kinase